MTSAPRLRILVCLAAMFLLLALIACGGGGGGGGGSTPPPPSTANNPVPTVSSVSPSASVVGTGPVQITVAGTGFISSSKVQWNGSALTTTYTSSTQLQATVPASDLATVGPAKISVVSPAPGGGTSADLTFTIENPAPAVTSASPSQLTVGSAQTLTLTGTGFVQQSVAQWNGAARVTTYVSGTQLQVALTAADLAATGSGKVSVVNPSPGGGASSEITMSILYAVPTIASLFPNSAVMGSGDIAMNVGGTGFGAASVVRWNGTPLQTTYLSGTVLSAVIPAADLVTNGTAQVTVYNPTPGGGISPSASFSITTYPVPILNSIYPTSVYVNSGTQYLTVYGSALQSVSVVQVNGTAVPTTPGYCWYSSDICSLTATIDASYFTSTGTLTISIYTPPPAGGTSNSASLTVNAPPAPTINYLQPNSAPIGSSDLSVTVTGSDFTAASVVLWNGSPLPTQYSGSGTLTATISRKNLATFGVSQVSVSTPSPGGGTSTALPFSTYLALPANDLVYSSATQLLYASVPSTAGASLGNSIVSIDPTTGVLGTPIWVGSEPNRMALSANGLTLWVGLDGAASVRKVDLSTGTAGTQFYLGGGPGIYNPPFKAAALAVMPGSPNTVGVADSSGKVTIYDSGIARSKTANGPGGYGSIGMSFDNSGSYLYAAGSGYMSMQVDSTGITSASTLNNSVNSYDLRYDNGRVYLTNGSVLDASTGTQLGVFSVSASQTANGPVAPDSSVGRAFMLVNPNYGFSYQVNAYDQSIFVLKGTLPVPFGSNPYANSPTRLIRWGQDGLAIPYGSQLYIFRTSLIRDLSSTLADVAVSVSAPSSGTTGSDVNYNITVKNNGPSNADFVTLLDFVPDGMTFKSLTTSQGTCAGGMVVRCNLGTLTSSSTANVQVIATALSSGTATNTATVSAIQGDSDTTNNSVNTDTSITGNAYAAKPTLYSITPSIAQAGTGAFTLSVTGDNFNAGSTIQWNGAALTTTFVNSTNLTAQVDATKVASLGWAWVNVTTPAPGGGVSSSLPFTMYQVVDVSTNDIVFDPFTRKIYGSVPSTATQVTGNSIVAIDPYTGALGTPMNVGSEPHRMAESDDGKYLYVGLDGAKSLTRIDLTTMSQGSVYPLTFTSYGQPISSTARDLAVMPGTPDTLAVDLGAGNGIGVFDISGATGTMRSTITGVYTGTSLAFPNASTVYSYNSDTWGTFDRWTVTASGLTALDSTTLNGMWSAFRLASGKVYGISGGVADPTSTPPKSLGVNAVSNQGPYNSFQPSAVAPDAANNLAFYTGSTTAGTANPYLVIFDTLHYEQLQSIQFPGNSVTGTDLLRWGSDGLAWQLSQWPSYLGTGTQVVLMRGPLVQPYLGVSNPVPGVASLSPTSTTHGSGNLYVTVTGTNFVPGAVVTWNGNERSTTFTDSTHLRVAIPASDVASAGSATIKVKNPGTGLSASSVTFTIN